MNTGDEAQSLPLVRWLLEELEKPVAQNPASDPVVEILNRARVRLSEWEPILEQAEHCPGGLFEALRRHQHAGMRRCVARIGREAVRLLEAR